MSEINEVMSEINEVMSEINEVMSEVSSQHGTTQEQGGVFEARVVEAAQEQGVQPGRFTGRGLWW